MEDATFDFWLEVGLPIIFPAIGLVVFFILFIVLIIRSYLPYKLLNEKEQLLKNRTRLQKLWGIVTFPFSFRKLFIKEKETERENIIFRYYMRFTRFCSRIPYAHFIPKFIVASCAELLVVFLTREEVLAGVLFCWSFSFFVLVSFVESTSSEFEEKTITLANKVFLWTVSMMTLLILILKFFFWGSVEHLFHNRFFEEIEQLAGMSLSIFVYSWGLPLWAKILVIILIAIFVATSYWYSRWVESQK